MADRAIAGRETGAVVTSPAVMKAEPRRLSWTIGAEDGSEDGRLPCNTAACDTFGPDARHLPKLAEAQFFQGFDFVNHAQRGRENLRYSFINSTDGGES